MGTKLSFVPRLANVRERRFQPFYDNLILRRFPCCAACNDMLAVVTHLESVGQDALYKVLCEGCQDGYDAVIGVGDGPGYIMAETK